MGAMGWTLATKGGGAGGTEKKYELPLDNVKVYGSNI